MGRSAGPSWKVSGADRGAGANRRALTMGLSMNGKPCIVRSALVAAAVSVNTTHAWPLNLNVFSATTSKTFPNWLKSAYMHFFSSARYRNDQMSCWAGRPWPLRAAPPRSQSGQTLPSQRRTLFRQLLIHIVDIECWAGRNIAHLCAGWLSKGNNAIVRVVGPKQAVRQSSAGVFGG